LEKNRIRLAGGGEPKCRIMPINRQAYAIDEPMKALDRWDRYQNAPATITKGENLPAEWATPEIRSMGTKCVARQFRVSH